MARKKLSPEERILRRRESINKWHIKNKDKVKKHTKKWHVENKDKVKKHVDEWNNNNKDYFKKWHASKRQNDPLYVLKSNIRSLISNSFKYKKTTSTNKILGCTFEEFKQHLESQFEPWMNWNNYGCKTPLKPNMTWDIDHIIPLSSATNEDDIMHLNHYKNLQPLCSFQNRFIKRNRII